MHYLAKLLVQGDNAAEALENARTDAEQLVEWGKFDWYDMDGRWGTSKAYSVTSKKGKELIEEGMKANREEFDRALESIRYMMDRYSDDDIYEENFDRRDPNGEGIYVSNYMFSIAGGDPSGPYVYAQDGDIWGGKVERERSLKNILEDNKDKKLWVVPVDFHN